MGCDMRVLRVILLMYCVVGIGAAGGCGGGDSAGDVDGAGDSCVRRLDVALTFWDSVCWSGEVLCDGAPVIYLGGGWDEGHIICDPEITCEEPAEIQAVYIFEYYIGSACRFCSRSDSYDVCIDLSESCDDEDIEVTASGSENEGPHPMTCCPGDPDCV